MNPLALSIHPWIIRFFCAFAFALPFSSWFASLLLAVIILLCIIYKSAGKTFFRFSSFIMFWLMSFYIVHLTGLINTSNFSYAGLDLQIKLSFLLLPILIDGIPVSNYDFRKIARTFIAGCTLFATVLLINATLEYLKFREISSFFYIDLCSVQHVAYFTLYINIALLFIADEFFRLPGFRLRNRYFMAILMVFLFLVITLLSSRTAAAASFITCSAYIFLISKHKYSMIRSSINTGIYAASMLVIFFLVATINSRFSEAVSSSTPAPVAASPEAQAESSTVRHNIRYEIWKNALAVFRENPLGTGTGDIRDELKKQYINSGFQEGISYNLNPHNQFLHTLIATGIQGLLILVILLFSAFRFAIRRKNYLLLMLLTASVINFLTESMLEKQAGVLFFVFFIVILSGQKSPFIPQQKAGA